MLVYLFSIVRFFEHSKFAHSMRPVHPTFKSYTFVNNITSTIMNCFPCDWDPCTVCTNMKF